MVDCTDNVDYRKSSTKEFSLTGTPGQRVSFNYQLLLQDGDSAGTYNPEQGSYIKFYVNGVLKQKIEFESPESSSSKSGSMYVILDENGKANFKFKSKVAFYPNKPR